MPTCALTIDLPRCLCDRFCLGTEIGFECARSREFVQTICHTRDMTAEEDACKFIREQVERRKLLSKPKPIRLPLDERLSIVGLNYDKCGRSRNGASHPLYVEAELSEDSKTDWKEDSGCVTIRSFFEPLLLWLISCNGQFPPASLTLGMTFPAINTKISAKIKLQWMLCVWWNFACKRPTSAFPFRCACITSLFSYFCVLISLFWILVLRISHFAFDPLTF